MSTVLILSEIMIDLSQSDIDKIDSAFLELIRHLQMYLVTQYDSISRADAKSLVMKEIKKFMGSNP